jgi:hypothetical protein
MVDWKKLEDEVDNAIEKGYLINFESKTIKECKYIQKVADERLSWLGIKINPFILLVAAGISLVIAIDANKNLLPSILNIQRFGN